MSSKPRWMALAFVLMSVPAWAGFDVQIIKRGAKLTHPSSATVGPTGRLFVAETSNGRIVELHPVTGEILSQITSDQGAFEPTDLAFDTSGRTIFWNNFLTGTIFKRNLMTGVSTQLADFDGVLISVAVNHQGRVFAAQLAPTPALWEVDPNGSKAPVLIAIVPGMNGIDAGPDGHVYAPDFFTGTGTIRKIDVDTGVVTVVATKLDFPVAVKFDGQGKFYVVEFLKGTISRIDLVTGEKTLHAKELPGSENFDFDQDGRIFAVNIVDSTVKRLFPGGGFRFLTREGMASPGPIAVRRTPDDEFVFVSTLFSIGKVRASTGKTDDLIIAVGMPDRPSVSQSLFDDGTNFITTSFLFNLVQVINPDTKQVVAFHTDFATPVNAIRFQGELAVAELGTGRVVRGSDRAPFISNLVFPAGLAATNDDLFVADRATGTIYQAVKDGVIQSTPLIIRTGLVDPEGMTLDPQGNLLIAETGRQRVVRLNLATQQLDVIASGLSIGLPALVGWPPVGVVLTGVAVSPSGTIYVAGDVDNVLYRIRENEAPAIIP